MTADQQFIIAMVTLILGGISTLAVAIIGYFTVALKSKLENVQKGNTR